MDSPFFIRSKPSLMRSSGSVCVIRSSILILPSMYQSTIFGTSVRPRAPPNAEPFQTRPVTSWKGLVAISAPAGATPMMIDIAHALETVIGAAARQIDEMGNELAAHVVGVHEVGHAETLGDRAAPRVDV